MRELGKRVRPHLFDVTITSESKVKLHQTGTPIVDRRRQIDLSYAYWDSSLLRRGILSGIGPVWPNSALPGPP